ncbi:unnamed protein product [Rhizoctonia solani]|uniref:Zn(2)-C6 fungal-type domain-containing protein n=1 Tax=Rhizoctonia solani TaxID=456999 RepID=A0A8H2XH50_9AGAM|nr:unnamed protein product [Rhizoctonia solani]
MANRKNVQGSNTPPHRQLEITLFHGAYIVMAEPRAKKTTLACDSCRRRKRKCDGRTPICSLCEKGNVECVYDATLDQRRPAQKSYVAALEARVKLLEEILRDAGAGDVAGPSGISADQTEEVDEEENQLPESIPPTSQIVPTQPTVPLNPNTEPTFVPIDEATTTDALKLMAQPQVEQSDTTASQLDLGMGGYTPGASLELEHQLLAQFWDWQRMHLPYVAPVPFLSAYAIFSEAVHPGEPIPPPPLPPPPNPFSGPTAIGIPRASEVEPTSDLAQFISPLLLDAMFAIAALFRGNAEVSDRFYERAKLKLFDEVAKPRLATVQAVSLMSTWELGHARAPATWTLNGVAVALRIISTPRHSSLAEANVLEASKEGEASTTGASASTSAPQSLPPDRPTVSDVGTTWWNPSTLGMGDVLIQAGWEALRDLIRMSDMLFDGIYAFNAPKREPREILELVTRNNVTIQRFLDDMPAWMRSTGAIRRKDNGLVYLHLFTHLTSILTCRPFLTPPTQSMEARPSNTSTEVSQPTTSSHIVRRYRTLAFRVARASALQIMSLVRHIPLSSPCVTLPYAVYSACTILLLSPEDPAAMDGVRTGLTCLDSMDETGYWVDSAKDASDRIKALARRWSVVVGPGKRVLGPLPPSGTIGPTEGASKSGEGPSRFQGAGPSGEGESIQRIQPSSSAAGETIIPSGSQSGQTSVVATRPSTGVDPAVSLMDSQTYTPPQPTSYEYAPPAGYHNPQGVHSYDNASGQPYVPQTYTSSSTTVPTQLHELGFQESDIDAAIAQALQDFGSAQSHVDPLTQYYPIQDAPTGAQQYDRLHQENQILGQQAHPDPQLYTQAPQQPQSSQYIPPPQYARDPVAMRRRQEQRQSQEIARSQQPQYTQQVQHHHPYIRQPKPTRKQQPMPHVAYALSHAEPEHDLHIEHHHWHTVIPPDPNLPFPPDLTACTDMAACFSHTVEHSHDPAFVNSMADPYAGVSVDWLADVGSSFPAMTFDTYYNPGQAGPSSGAAGPSTYMQGPGGYGYMGGPGT